MLVLQHGAIKRLVESGHVDVWTPAMQNAAGVPELDLGALEDVCEVPEPALNIQHVVRRRYSGPGITHAKGECVRVGVLQDLTPLQAAAAGFKNTEAFFRWFREKYGTGPIMRDPIPCWVTTYRNVTVDIPQFMARPIPGKQGDYTGNAARSLDDLESVDAADWAKREQERRERDIAQAKLLRKMRWRHGKKAA